MAGVFAAIACGGKDVFLNPAVTLGAAVTSGDYSTLLLNRRRGKTTIELEFNFSDRRSHRFAARAWGETDVVEGIALLDTIEFTDLWTRIKL